MANLGPTRGQWRRHTSWRAGVDAFPGEPGEAFGLTGDVDADPPAARTYSCQWHGTLEGSPCYVCCAHCGRPDCRGCPDVQPEQPVDWVFDDGLDREVAAYGDLVALGVYGELQRRQVDAVGAYLRAGAADPGYCPLHGFAEPCPSCQEG